MKHILLITSVFVLGACSAGSLAALTAVGVAGTAINIANKGSDPSADDTIDAVTDAYKQDENTSFDLNK